MEKRPVRGLAAVVALHMAGGASAVQLAAPKPLPLAERPVDAWDEATTTVSTVQDVAGKSWDEAIVLEEPARSLPRQRGKLQLENVVLPLLPVLDGPMAPRATAVPPSPPPPPSPSAATASSATDNQPPGLGSLVSGRQSRGRRRVVYPPPAPRAREAPLLGNLATLTARGQQYVRGHIGVEAALALFTAGLLSLCALGCVASAFCSYSLCCMGRGKPRGAGGTPRGTSLTSTPRRRVAEGLAASADPPPFAGGDGDVEQYRAIRFA